jgi:hypothetical protein
MLEMIIVKIARVAVHVTDSYQDLVDVWRQISSLIVRHDF